MKAQLAGELVAKYPECGLLYMHQGNALLVAGKTPQAVDAYRKGLPLLADNPDAKTRLLVNMVQCVEDHQEKLNLLDEAIALQGNLVAAAQAALIKRMLLRERPAGGAAPSKPHP